MTNYDVKDRYFSELSEFIDRQVLDYVCLESGGDDSHIVGGLELISMLRTSLAFFYLGSSPHVGIMCAILHVATMCAILPPKSMIIPCSCDHDNHSCF